MISKSCKSDSPTLQKWKRNHPFYYETINFVPECQTLVVCTSSRGFISEVIFVNLFLALQLAFLTYSPDNLNGFLLPGSLTDRSLSARLSINSVRKCKVNQDETFLGGGSQFLIFFSPLDNVHGQFNFSSNTL